MHADANLSFTLLAISKPLQLLGLCWGARNVESPVLPDHRIEGRLGFHLNHFLHRFVARVVFGVGRKKTGNENVGRRLIPCIARGAPKVHPEALEITALPTFRIEPICLRLRDRVLHIVPTEEAAHKLADFLLLALRPTSGVERERKLTHR